MSEFKVINTQEEFDAAIKDRLDRERATVEKKYGDYETLKEKAAELDRLKGLDYEGKIKDLEGKLSDAKSKLDTTTQTVSDLTARAAAAENALLKGKIAHEYKIPYELSGKLSGGTEDELRKDAEAFAKYVGNNTVTAPLASTEPVKEDANKAALKATLQNLNLTGGK